MKGSLLFLIIGGFAIGLGCPSAYAEDFTNEYFNTNTPFASDTVLIEGSRKIINGTTLIEQSVNSPVIVERTLSSPVVVDRITTSPALVERTISSPVVIEGSISQPVVIEDRVIKQKHFFGIGIWPLFDFEIM